MVHGRCAGLIGMGFQELGLKGKKLLGVFKENVTKGKKVGIYIGRVAVRASGFFNVSTKNGTTQGISWRYCQRVQVVDGYNYFN